MEIFIKASAYVREGRKNNILVKTEGRSMFCLILGRRRKISGVSGFKGIK